MAKKKGITIQQIEDAIIESAGVLSEASRVIGCSQANISARVNKSARLKAVMKEYEEIYIGIAESQLRKHMDEGNPSVCMFYLKCKGGYSERQIIDANVNLTQDDWVKKMEQIEADKAGRTKTKAKK